MRVIILFLMLLVSTVAKESVVERKNVHCIAKESIVIDTTTIEGRVIKIFADSGYSVRMQRILLAQAKYESGGFKNSLCKKYNNVFSMLHSKRDPYSVGNWGFAEGRTGYAVYKSLEESVYARLWYSRKWKYPLDASAEEYVHHIKMKRYFEANECDYLDGIEKLISSDSHLFENKSVTIACM